MRIPARTKYGYTVAIKQKNSSGVGSTFLRYIQVQEEPTLENGYMFDEIFQEWFKYE